MNYNSIKIKKLDIEGEKVYKGSIFPQLRGQIKKKYKGSMAYILIMKINIRLSSIESQPKKVVVVVIIVGHKKLTL